MNRQGGFLVTLPEEIRVCKVRDKEIVGRFILKKSDDGTTLVEFELTSPLLIASIQQNPIKLLASFIEFEGLKYFGAFSRETQNQSWCIKYSVDFDEKSTTTHDKKPQFKILKELDPKVIQKKSFAIDTILDSFSPKQKSVGKKVMLETLKGFSTIKKNKELIKDYCDEVIEGGECFLTLKSEFNPYCAESEVFEDNEGHDEFLFMDENFDVPFSIIPQKLELPIRTRSEEVDLVRFPEVMKNDFVFNSASAGSQCISQTSKHYLVVQAVGEPFYDIHPVTRIFNICNDEVKPSPSKKPRIDVVAESQR